MLGKVLVQHMLSSCPESIQSQVDELLVRKPRDLEKLGVASCGPGTKKSFSGIWAGRRGPYQLRQLPCTSTKVGGHASKQTLFLCQVVRVQGFNEAQVLG